MLIASLCAGYILYKPKLINADKPFIELAGSVGKAVGNAKDAQNRITPVPSGTPVSNLTPTPTPTPTPWVKPTPVPDNKVTIRVEDMSIYVNKYRCIDFDDVQKQLSNGVKDDTKVTLIDDYAELKTFRSVVKLLKQLGITDYSTSRVD